MITQKTFTVAMRILDGWQRLLVIGTIIGLSWWIILAVCIAISAIKSRIMGH